MGDEFGKSDNRIMDVVVYVRGWRLWRNAESAEGQFSISPGMEIIRQKIDVSIAEG